ncbi:hypothetical protein [Streptomyces sp. NPDC002889]|uniref:hypothetical protein n=1 Tax=Streptomyces sp. NPDC002889 TaxID=3364669 RepID=UPI003697E148
MIGQPFKIRAEEGPGKAGYIPDLMLLKADGAVTIANGSPTAGELCPSEHVLDWAEGIIHALGWSYEWWSGPDDEQFFTNVNALGGFNWPMHQSQQALIEPVLALCADSELPIDQVEEHFSQQTSRPLVRGIIQRLLWWGDLTTDLCRPIGTGTRVRTDAAARRPAPAQWDVVAVIANRFRAGTRPWSRITLHCSVPASWCASSSVIRSQAGSAGTDLSLSAWASAANRVLPAPQAHRICARRHPSPRSEPGGTSHSVRSAAMPVR